ncbi:MAG TPA: DUF4105 domain-containing protein [Flavipsychrobacter sp.]|nr:DUF4105 domain-containing protein [Flavipsychrobacter sp.]
MIRFFLLLLISVFLFNSIAFSSTPDTSRLRISLITCGAGLQPWETFGHTAIRITDSIKGTDNVYNYGTFNGYDEEFLIKFTRGKLLYYLSSYPYRQFLLEYSEAGRSVAEQELRLPGAAKQALYEYLDWNALEENRYYKYDFFYDNCATRIRDVFSRALGKQFQVGDVLPEERTLSFREIINQYFYRVHWQRFGVNILLGSKIDKIMTDAEIMFLPDYLQEGILKSSYKGQKVSSDPVTILPGFEAPKAGLNGPFFLMLFIALLTIGGLCFKKFSKVGSVMSFLVLLLTGLIGCFIIVMWLGTDHQACQNNFNLLWALPTNVIIAFSSKKNKDKYSLIGILLIFVSLLLHLLQIQQLPIFELSPFLLSLLFIYGMIYRKNKTNKFDGNV